MRLVAWLLVVLGATLFALLLTLPIWLLLRLLGRDVELGEIFGTIVAWVIAAWIVGVFVGGSLFGLYFYVFVEPDTTGIVVFGVLCGFIVLGLIQNGPEWWDEYQHRRDMRKIERGQ